MNIIYVYVYNIAHLSLVAGCCLADLVGFHSETHLHSD